MSSTAPTDTVPAKPDLWHRALGELKRGYAAIKSEWDALRLRESAEKMQRATDALGFYHYSVQFSLMYADAERWIAQNNPPQQGRRTDLEVDTEAMPLTTSTRSKIRAAHGGLTDAQYDDLKADAVAQLEPLSRRKIERAAKAIAKRDQNAGAPEIIEPKKKSPPPPASDTALRKRIEALEAERDELMERVAILTEERGAAEIDKRFTDQIAVIKSLRQEVAHWQHKFEASARRVAALEKRSGAS